MKRIRLSTRLTLLVLGVSLSGMGCFGPGSVQQPPDSTSEPSATPEQWEVAATPTPPPVPTVAGSAPLAQFTRRSEKLFIVIVSPETRQIIDADKALEIANRRSFAEARVAPRVGVYLIKVGDLRKRMDVPPLPDDHPLWVVSYQGIKQAQYVLESQVRIDAFSGKVYDTGTTRGKGAGALKIGMAFFDPPGLPPLVLPTLAPRRTPSVTQAPGPYPVALTEAEKKLMLEVALQDPVLQRELAQDAYEVKATYGQVIPQYGRVGTVHIYLKDTAVYYAPAVDLANKKLIFRNPPLIGAPGQRVALTVQEEKAARDTAYASALVKEKMTGKALIGDFVVGYLSDKKEKMAVVVVYTGERLALHALVDLTRRQTVSQTLREVTTFPKPLPGPPPGLTPTPTREARPVMPTPPPFPVRPPPARN